MNRQIRSVALALLCTVLSITVVSYLLNTRVASWDPSNIATFRLSPRYTVLATESSDSSPVVSDMVSNVDSGLVGTTRSAWGSWASWGGSNYGTPSVGSVKNEGLDVFTADSAGAISYRAGHHGSLGAWQKLGGACSGSPVSVTHDSGDMDVACLGIDGHIAVTTYLASTGKWSGFKGTSFTAGDQPALMSWGGGELVLLARKTLSGEVYKATRNSGSTKVSSWYKMGSEKMRGGLVGVTLKKGTAGEANCYALSRDSEGVVQWTLFQAGFWSGKWHSLNTYSTCDPSVSARSLGFDVVLRGVDGRILTASMSSAEDDGGWSDVTDLGGATIGCPAMASHDNGPSAVFVRSGKVDVLAYRMKAAGDSGAWADWGALAGTWISDPVAQSREDKYLDVWEVNDMHSLMHASMGF